MEIKTDINNAFFKLESFMNGTLTDYQYFDFNKAFTNLFTEAKKYENFTYETCKLISMYWSLIYEICYSIDKGEFENTDAYENDEFYKVWNDLERLEHHRIEEFCEFTTPDEEEEESRFSITDIFAFEKQQTIEKPQPIVKQKPELKIDQIALKYAYEGLQITRENGNEIAKKYGHNSGEKLFQRFTYFLSPANRKGKPIPCTPKKLNNKIKLIESVIKLLPKDKQERAKDEVSILKRIYETEY